MAAINNKKTNSTECSYLKNHQLAIYYSVLAEHFEGKQTFSENNSKIHIYWWSTSKTLSIQGPSDIVKGIEGKLDNLLEKYHSLNQSNQQQPQDCEDFGSSGPPSEKKTPKRKRSKVKSELTETQQQFKKIWKAINEIQSAVANPDDKNSTKNIPPPLLELAPSRNSTDEAKQSKITNYFPVISYPDYCKLIHKASKIAELESTVNKLESDNKKLLKKVERLKSKNKKVKSKLNSDKQKAEPSKLNKQPLKTSKSVKKTKQNLVEKQPAATSQQQPKKDDMNKPLPGNNKNQPEKKTKHQESTVNQGKSPTTSKYNNGNTKPVVFVAGDSMLKNLKGYLMSRTKSVKIPSFPGASTEDMKDFIKPLLNREPNHIVLHVGTNNLADHSPNQIVEEMKLLVDMIIS